MNEQSALQLPVTIAVYCPTCGKLLVVTAATVEWPTCCDQPMARVDDPA